jgi:hypothetical protein
LTVKQVREKDFDVANFLNVLEPYYKGGEYDYLLNSDKQLDLLSKRFIVFGFCRKSPHLRFASGSIFRKNVALSVLSINAVFNR